jgi:hypothetical protein
MVTKGSCWSDGKGKMFRVLDVPLIESETWVLYRTEPPKGMPTADCKEYSCLVGAFEQRFFPYAE